MHIVLKWISLCLSSNTRILLDSAFVGHLREWVSLSLTHTLTHAHKNTDTHVHTQTRTGMLVLLLKRCSTSNCFKGLCSQAHHLSPFFLKSPSHLLPLSSSFHPFLHPPSHIVSLALLSSLTLSVLLSVPQTTWLPSKMWLKRMISSLSSLLPSSLPLFLPPLF